MLSAAGMKKSSETQNEFLTSFQRISTLVLDDFHQEFHLPENGLKYLEEMWMKTVPGG